MADGVGSDGGVTKHPENWRIPRKRLVEQLEAAVAGPVTVIAAPAGSGKTVLVSSWIESRSSKQPVASISVERGERDAQRFWSAMVEQLREVRAIELEVPAPTLEDKADVLVKRLSSELADLDRDLVLVIDNVHEIAGADILEQLTYLLDRLPSTAHVVLISRRDPQLGLHRRRLEGGLTEIRNEQLQFTVDETRQMLAALKIELSDQSVELLHKRTEGWAAGLRLAAVSLASSADPERFVAEFSGSERTVAEYLLAEVLNSQPPEVRRLLVRTSLLDRVNGELGDLLTGNAGSEHHLRTLAETGGFVVALDAHGTWFRFHHLFADLLAVELRHAEPAELPRLHAAAAGWYAEHGYPTEAIEHAQAAGDESLAAGLLIANYVSLVLDGRQATAHALLEAYKLDPDGMPPEIAVVVATDELLGGSLQQVGAYLALAERNAEAVPADRRYRFEMALLVTRLSLAQRLGDFRTVLNEVQPDELATDLRTGHDVEMYNDVRALILMNLGIVEVWSGHEKDGERDLLAGRDLAQEIGRPYLEVCCQVHLGQAITWRSFTLARDACAQAIALAERYGWASDPGVAPASVTYGVSLVQAGRLDEAELWLARADRTLRADLEPAVGYVLQMAYGAVQLARGDYAQAIERCRTAETLGLQLRSDSLLHVQMRSSMLYAMVYIGDFSALRETLAELTDQQRAASEIREVAAALALAEGDTEAALSELAPVLVGEVDVDRRIVQIRSHLLQAHALYALHQSTAAQDAVEQALELAQTDGLVLPFMFTHARELLERHPRHRTAHGAFMAEILDAFSGDLPAADSEQPARPRDELSDAELRVLGYLPTNLSAAAIASEIYLSMNTVKTHMRHIYAKLDVHSRREAVARARELGLLGHSARQI